MQRQQQQQQVQKHLYHSKNEFDQGNLQGLPLYPSIGNVYGNNNKSNGHGLGTAAAIAISGGIAFSDPRKQNRQANINGRHIKTDDNLLDKNRRNSSTTDDKNSCSTKSVSPDSSSSLSLTSESTEGDYPVSIVQRN